MVQSNTKEVDKNNLEAEVILTETDFRAHLELLGDIPCWLKEIKHSQWKAYQKLPYPKRNDENWRFSNVKAVSQETYHVSLDGVNGDAGSLISSSDEISIFSGRLVLANDEVILNDFSNDKSNNGVIFLPVKDAISQHEDLFKKYFMSHQSDIGSDKFQSLQNALLRNGTFLFVPKGVEVDLPFVSYHWAQTTESAIFPYTLIVTEENAKVCMVDVFQSANNDDENFICGATHIYAGAGSQVNYEAVQNWNLNSLAFHLNTVRADRDTNVKTVSLNLGSKYLRSEQHTRVVGVGSNVENYSLSVPSGKQEFDQRTLQTHSSPNSRSDLLYKNALLDDSRTIFSGLIRVLEDAQLTDAYQTNRNLLLSNTAEANALPGLEILANDVKCSHGATTGQIEQDQLFYLLSRGIPKKAAQKLLVFGFFEEIIEKLENSELKENVRELIDKKFHD